ncbi:hypothetical protein CVS47_00322 [Microbacterium lemovicicum]|uniref:Uncharacterized protein n=1 Tax=Microbacterium lemovicicum TaxID=1072463 RepID=A0A3S9W6R2_9MICO|nr:DUF6052 family protein [Microbacterium lemovicicum]AZS35725.1 hypothetical protein CVS47_00322 [Microbacterium lemovicicum]
MSSTILNLPLTDDERAILEVYSALKDLCARDLPPYQAANLRDALASVSIVVTGATLDYENLIDHGI